MQDHCYFMCAAVCASVTTLSTTGQRGKDHSKNNFTMCCLCTFQELVWGLLTAELGMTVNISYIYLQALPSRHAVSVQAHLLLHVLSVPMVWDAQGYLGSPTHLGNADKYFLLYHNLGSPVFRSPQVGSDRPFLLNVFTTCTYPRTYIRIRVCAHSQQLTAIVMAHTHVLKMSHIQCIKLAPKVTNCKELVIEPSGAQIILR